MHFEALKRIVKRMCRSLSLDLVCASTIVGGSLLALPVH